jgi:hypothetical protein
MARRMRFGSAAPPADKTPLAVTMTTREASIEKKILPSPERVNLEGGLLAEKGKGG